MTVSAPRTRCFAVVTVLAIAAVLAACTDDAARTPQPPATPAGAPAATPSASPTDTPTAEPAAAPPAISTSTPTPERAVAPAAIPTSTPAPEPAAPPTATPTATPPPTPTATPTATPSPTSVATPGPIAAESSAPEAASTPATADAPVAVPTDTDYAGLLRTIPDTPELRRAVYINDYALVRRMFDIPLPGPGDDDDALAEFYGWLPPAGFEGEADDPPVRGFGAISFFGPFSQFRNIVAENLRYLAFDVRSMDQSIVAVALPATFDVVRGRFDPQATDKALESCSGCEPPIREEYGGVSYYRWGGDYAPSPQRRFAPPAFDEIGRGGRLAVLDEYVFRTLGTSDMEALIAASLNEGASLADVEAFRLLAGGMFLLGAYTMFLSDDVGVWDVDRHDAEGGPWLRPYEALASGAGKDENGHYMALVLVHADAASAQENVGLLRRIIEEEGSVLYDISWSDYIDVARSEIHADGRLLLAKLRGRFANNWRDWVIQRDGLILYE